MLNAITRTTNAWAPLLLRLALGGVMLPHGLQKAFGLWGGQGWKGTMRFLTHGMHIPAPLAAMVIITEFAGAACLILGLLTRVWALGFTVLMSVAIATVHYKNGMFMNWTGKQGGEGFEYHILAIGIALALLILGGGKASLDAKLGKGGGGSKGSSSSKPKPAKPAKKPSE
jgi:putative oxidoreductase